MTGGYCTHLCQQDADCCAAPGECVEQIAQVTRQSTEASNQYKHACELPYEPPASVVERFISILKSEDFQQALVEATEYKRGEIANFRQMLGRSSAVRSLNKFS